MVRFSRSVLVRTDPGRVFALVTDAARKARLNPGAEVIQVEQETPGSIGTGTVIRFVLRFGGRVIDYRSRCVSFEPGRLIETISDTDPSFSVRVTVEAEGDQTRLTQEEWFEFSRASRPPVERKGRVGLLTKIAAAIHGHASAQPQALTREQEAEVETKLGSQLVCWLEAIRTHLEAAERPSNV